LQPPVKRSHREKFSGKLVVSGNLLIYCIRFYYQDKIATKEKPAGVCLVQIKLAFYHNAGLPAELNNAL
jgi:hypothetical protein